MDDVLARLARHEPKNKTTSKKKSQNHHDGTHFPARLKDGCVLAFLLGEPSRVFASAYFLYVSVQGFPKALSGENSLMSLALSILFINSRSRPIDLAPDFDQGSYSY
jgi:hypothetical protein